MSLFKSLDRPDSEDITSGSKLIVPVFETTEYKLEQILFKINHIDTLSEQEIKNIIYRQYDTILDYDNFISKEREYALALLTNPRFLRILIDIIGSIELDEHQTICINKLAYDYYSLKEKDKEISELLMQLSHIINNKTSIRLSAILGINGSRILAMVNKSSFKIEKNVKRTNRFLVKSNIALSIQDIVDIYCILYPRMTYPIIYTMLEEEPVNISNEELQRFRAISSAVLILLNAMTTNDIFTVILTYAHTMQYLNTGSKTRFSIKEACIKNNLDRIHSVIKQVELDTEDCPVCL